MIRESKPLSATISAAAIAARMRKDEHAPYSAMIEIADRCNEVCIHCYQVQGQKGEMSTDDVKNVIDQLAEMGVLFLTISGGEPTLRDDFLEIVRHARAKRFAVKIYTNGLTMTDRLAAALAEHAVQEVQISLYSHRAEVHEWITRVPGSFERTIAGAKSLVAHGVKVVLKSPVFTVNADELDPYLELVRSVGADYTIDTHIDGREDGDETPIGLSIEDDPHLAILRDPRLGRRPAESGEREPRLDRSLCGACSGHVHVEPNGELRPCTQLTVPVGHAIRDGVETSWRQHRDATMLRHVTWADLHGCRACDLHAYCTRCFANARSEGGDAFGPYARACHRAKLEYRVAHGVEPIVVADDGRDPALGPYRRTAEHRFETTEDLLSPEDVARRRSHPWVTGNPTTAIDDVVHVRPGDLVRLRRPGRSVAREERVPAGHDSGESGAPAIAKVS